MPSLKGPREESEAQLSTSCLEEAHALGERFKSAVVMKPFNE